MTRFFTLLCALALPFGLAACSPPGEGQAAKSLKIKVQDGEKAEVGQTKQLALSFAGANKGQLMTSATMIEKEDQVAKWFAEPADAVEFDNATAKVKLLKPGKVKVWAVYTQAGEELKSNVIEFEITKSDVKPKAKAAEPKNK